VLVAKIDEGGVPLLGRRLDLKEPPVLGDE